ncbi:TPA: hypothetical protein DEP21_00745 [Patescibacteria group bacterium]|nr:hypothetical protein [Candidatus Gracilibacteria bacterium]
MKKVILTIAPLSKVNKKNKKNNEITITRLERDTVNVRTEEINSFTSIVASKIEMENHILILNNSEYSIINIEYKEIEKEKPQKEKPQKEKHQKQKRKEKEEPKLELEKV